MTTRAERARVLAMAFLYGTDCKATKLDDVGAAIMLRVERLGHQLVFHFLHDHDPDPVVAADAGDLMPVRYFAEVQEILERRRWRPGLLDV